MKNRKTRLTKPRALVALGLLWLGLCLAVGISSGVFAAPNWIDQHIYMGWVSEQLWFGEDKAIYTNGDTFTVHLDYDADTTAENFYIKKNGGDSATTIFTVDASGNVNIPTGAAYKINGSQIGPTDLASVTATAAEINYLDNENLTADDLTKLAAVDASADEIDTALDGIGATVTYTNLDTVTDGSNADALHLHLYFGWTDTADAEIGPYRMVELDASGDTVVATLASKTAFAMHLDNTTISGTETLNLGVGKVSAVSASPIKAGHYIKAAGLGKVTELVTADLTGTTIDSDTGGDFGNQPANDGVELVSSSSGDTTQTATVIGTTHGGETVVTEEVALTGDTPASTSKSDWGVILAVKFDASTTGDITVREASGDQTITTVSSPATSAGVITVPAADQGAMGVKPTSSADDATTKYIGIQYVNAAGSTAYQADQLNGATAQTFTTEANLVTEVYVGDVEAARTATVKVGAEEDELGKKGIALSTVTAADQTVTVLMLP